MDVVKIDKSFVDRITLDPEGAAMVRSVIDLSSALGLTTIAEGVEEADQFALLDALGCDSVQGYLFARPMPSERVRNTFAESFEPKSRSWPAHDRRAYDGEPQSNARAEE